jgi:hypothetical protein
MARDTGTVTIQSRFVNLRRLAAIYGMLEHTDSLSLDRANAALQDVKALLEQQTNAARTAAVDGRDALVHENHSEWLMSESQREFSLWNQASLDAVLRKRKESQQQAVERYRESLLQRDQMDAIANKARIARAAEIVRREQAETDDRHLSRARWLAQREAGRVNRS